MAFGIAIFLVIEVTKVVLRQTTPMGRTKARQTGGSLCIGSCGSISHGGRLANLRFSTQVVPALRRFELYQALNR